MTWSLLGTNPALDAALGRGGASAPRLVPRFAYAPQLRRVRSPVEDARAVVARLDGAEMGTAPRLPYAIRARYGAVGPDERPGVGYHGPECCLREAHAQERKVHLMDLPHEFECPTCRTVWVIEMGMVEVFDGR